MNSYFSETEKRWPLVHDLVHVPIPTNKPNLDRLDAIQEKLDKLCIVILVLVALILGHMMCD